MIQLQTDRLEIVPITTADAPFLLKLMNDPDWIRNIGDRNVHTLADAKDYINQRIIPSYAEFGMGFYLVRVVPSQEPIGISGIIKRSFLQSPDIGFAFQLEHRGKGYAIEATKAIFNYGIHVKRLEKIVAITIPSNQSSIRLLERLGLQFERFMLEPGTGTKLMLYSWHNDQ